MALIPERRGGPGTLNVAKCLNDAVEQGRVSRAGAEKALREVERIIADNPGLNEGQAAAAAAESLSRDAIKQRQQTALQIMATDARLNDVAGYSGSTYEGVWAVFGRDLKGKATYSNVEGRQMAVRGILHGKLADLLDAYRSTALGLRRDVVGLTRFVRELYGEATGDGAAANAAAAWRGTAEYARLRFNKAGGTIADRAGWRLPQTLDSDAVKKAGRSAFIDYMEQAVTDGRLRIWDYEANAPVDALRRAEIISQAYERISSNGVSDLVPGATGGTKLANARSDARAFEWTNADGWLDAQRRFGKGDPGIFDMLVGHVDGMAADIAQLEILGPNSAATARLLIDTAKKAGATEVQVNRLENLWGHVSGASLSPVRGWLATMGSSVRAWLSSVQLGSAIVGAVTDFQTLRQTAAWNGLGANGVIGEYLRLMNPASAADRKLAVRAGLIADGWARGAIAAQRSMMEEIGQTLPQRMSNFVMRASGLEAHTQMAKWAFGMEFLGRLADDATKRIDQLEPALQRTMQRYGISGAEWDTIRSKGLFEEDGVSLIFPEQIIGAGGQAEERAATRLLEMVNTERGFAVLEPEKVERSLMLGSSQAGTLQGEFLRSTLQYKSFAVTMITRHLYRGVNAGGPAAGGAYLGRLAVGLTVFGALALQLREIAKGKDPRDMSDWKFWGAAFFQGGGTGIFGDFLNAGLNRADRGFYMTAIGGPTAGLVDDLIKLGTGNIAQAAADKDTHFGRELANFVRRNTPGTSVWYARLALDRLMWDQLQSVLDPEAYRAWSRMQDRARRETRQEFFWGPGQTAPERAPDLGAAIGVAGR